ncbi:amino acid transporter [Microlunatus flavus]|uniref:Amino acid transporter n=1 Tax=Microlunatus flavus TaxID=1036181 RepID=A0A1H9DJ75_9ACTN|nr:Amino acid transporter [Microlunatus flavus]
MTTTVVPGSTTRTGPAPHPVRAWLMDGTDAHPERHPAGHPGPHAAPAATEKKHSWWKVMCLTGVDYFSTLGYQPGIAALAAGAVSPLATLVLVALTLLGALPVYRRVAQESPHGEGSIAMLERLMSFWKGKLLVLVLLGFAATDFMITMTLSAADATAHLTENPHLAPYLGGHQVVVTLVLLGLLGAVFLRGFSEAIGIAVGLVGVYLVLNVVVIAVGVQHVLTAPHLFVDWKVALLQQHGGDPLMVVAIALLVFPKLALGLSGFETGVAIMPHVADAEGDTAARPTGRIRGARRLLTTAAVIMSVFLIASSLVTTLLIPAAAFQPGGPANGRALAYLAHSYLGGTFGSVYDASTVAILWFAGASAMAGLLNLIPRYLPRYGMAPGWTRAVRPLVLILTAGAFLITVVFDADVDAQGGAYATGVLVLITSAALAVTLAAHHAGQRRRTVAFGIVTLVFGYTTAANVVERPDGVKIAAIFIAAILAVSFASRLGRAFELRVTDVTFDDLAARFIRDCAHRTIRLVANEPDRGDRAEYSEKLRQVTRDNDLPDSDVIFVEITITDPSDFSSRLDVVGEVRCGRYRVLRLSGPTVPNAIAALMLAVRDRTGCRPHVYFEWTEGNPAVNLLRFLLFGVGEAAPVTREVLRRAERDRSRRPHVHVG